MFARVLRFSSPVAESGCTQPVGHDPKPNRGPVLRWMSLSLGAFIVWGCNAEQPTAPDVDPAPAIVDAAHSSGVEHFYFLPPLVPNPSVDGTFDPTLAPEVEICELDGQGACTTLATYTMTSGPGSETVRLEAEDEHYIVNWHTDDFALDPALTYRIVIVVAGSALGWADVDVVSNGNELKNVDTGQFIALKDGRTLPVKFRIEEGAVFVVGAGGGSVTAEDGAVVLDVPAGSVAGDVGITVQAVGDISGIPADVGALAGSVFEFGPDGTTFDPPALLTLRYDEGAIPAADDETRLAIYTEDNGVWSELPSAVDPDGNTVSALVDGFSAKAVGFSSGYHHTCAIVGDEAFCWGRNHYGQLGDGTETDSPTPVQVLGGPYESVTTGVGHSCATTPGGTVNCWGIGSFIGDGGGTANRTTPSAVSGGPYQAVAAGAYHTCAHGMDGSVECWGQGYYGQLGNGSQAFEPTPTAVQGGPYAELTVGYLHSCGRLATGMVDCWGWGAHGQLGNGTTTNELSPFRAPGGPYDEVGAGAFHTCGRLAPGTVECWGDGQHGQMGNGSFQDHPSPAQVSGGPYDQLSVGMHYACGLDAGGTAECWGNNFHGQLGNGGGASQSSPVPVLGGPYDAVYAGWYTTCATTPANGTDCWGYNPFGQTGTGSTDLNVVVPLPVLGLPDPALPIEHTIRGGDDHSCALRSTGDLYCWGSNNKGQLGNGSFTASNVPVAVAGGLTFATVSLGNAHTCGVTTSSEAYCWGNNGSGQLGDGTTTNRSMPVAVTGGTAFVAIDVGAYHSCAVTGAGEAFCWGANNNGRLGDGNTMDSSVPLAVSGGLAFASISGGSSHTCAVTDAGVGYCWGRNQFNQLGDGTGTDRLVPTPVSGGLSFGSVSAGNTHSCAITTSDSAFCWGRSSSGQVGDGTFTLSHSAPTAVAGGLSFASIESGSAFGLHTCGLTLAGEPYCWGSNVHGQLGDGTLDAQRAPNPVVGGHTFEAIAAGKDHSCGLTSTDEALCWGRDAFGQLGDGNLTDSSVPVTVEGPFAPPPAVCPAGDMTHWWPADGGSPADVIGTMDLTALNGGGYAAGVAGDAFDLSGTGYFKSAPFGTPLTGDFTMDFWFNPNSVPGLFGSPFASSDDFLQAGSYQVEYYSSHYNVDVRDGADRAIWFTPGFTGTWTHVAVTYVDATRTVTAYLMGQPVTPSGGAEANPMTLGVPMQIDLVKLGYNRGTSVAWDGLLDELHIFDRALTAAEVDAIYTGGCGAPPPP